MSLGRALSLWPFVSAATGPIQGLSKGGPVARCPLPAATKVHIRYFISSTRSCSCSPRAPTSSQQASSASPMSPVLDLPLTKHLLSGVSRHRGTHPPIPLTLAAQCPHLIPGYQGWPGTGILTGFLGNLTSHLHSASLGPQSQVTAGAPSCDSILTLAQDARRTASLECGCSRP